MDLLKRFMKKVPAIKTVLTKQIYEIPSEQYFSKYLRAGDVAPLQNFLTDFNSRLSIPSAILAVGSSTFPDSFWADVKKYNAEDPKLNGALAYGDIDLLVVPEAVTRLNHLEKFVSQTLDEMHLPFVNREDTTMGVTYCDGSSVDVETGKSTKCKLPWLNLGYGVHSIATQLENGTKLDLIFGREDLMTLTAKEKIAQERKENYAFSLLYQK